MGLFSHRHALPRQAEFKFPVRRRSEYRATGWLAWLGRHLARFAIGMANSLRLGTAGAAREVRLAAEAAVNDTRIVAVLLILAALALALEMAASLRRL